MIEGLIERGYAYPAGGDVYFAWKKMMIMAGYRPPVGDMQAGARIEVAS
jgi:cysteinyl-tRNA synthetase